MCIRTMSHGAWTMDYALPRPHPTPVPPSPRETGANHSGSCMAAGHSPSPTTPVFPVPIKPKQNKRKPYRLGPALWPSGHPPHTQLPGFPQA